MAEPANNSAIVNFNFPLNDQGIKDGCKSIIETLDKLPVSEKVNICVTFEAKDRRDLISMKFERNVFSQIDLAGLDKTQIETIKSIFIKSHITVNTLNSNAETYKDDKKEVVNGNKVSSIAVNADLSTLRQLCPGMSDEAIMEMFKIK